MGLYNKNMKQRLVHIRHILVTVTHIMSLFVLGVDVFN